MESLVHGEPQNGTLATDRESQQYEYVETPRFEMQQETLNPQMVTTSPIPALQNHRIAARILGETEPQHESAKRPNGLTPSHLNEITPNKPQTTRLSGLAKEVAALNGSSTQLGPLDILKDSRIHVTRRTLKVVTALAANKEPLPRQSLDVALLADGSAAPLPDEAGNGDEGSQYEGSSQSTISDGVEGPSTPNRDLSYSPHGIQLTRPSKKQIPGRLSITPKHPDIAGSSPRGLPVMKLLAQGPLQWEEWHKQKANLYPTTDRVLSLIDTQGYSHKAEAWSLSQQPGYHPLMDLPSGYNITKDAGIDVFSPTKEVFEEFSNFLAVVEEISGRDNGVVKVIVPETAVLPVLSVDLPGMNQTLLPTSKLRLSAAKIESKEVSLYKLQVLPAAEVRVSPEAIEQHRTSLKTKWSLDARHLPDAWKETRFETTVTESQMIKQLLRGAGNSLFTMNVKCNVALRHALACNDPHLNDLLGKRPTGFFSKLDNFRSTSMAITHHGVNAFVMHTKELAAYSVNYLHKGAPKVWTVIKPRDHKQLEEAIHYLTVDKLSLTPDCKLPLLPPQCDQFLRHEALYLPKKTLTACRVLHAEVVQYQNEMIITFPFAYCQGYNTGPNISEGIAFMSKRSEVFLENGLYRHCSNEGCSCVSPRQIGLDFPTNPDLQRLEDLSTGPPYESTGIPRKGTSEPQANHPGGRAKNPGVQRKSFDKSESEYEAFEQRASPSSVWEGRRYREQRKPTDRSFKSTSDAVSQPRHIAFGQSRGLLPGYAVDHGDPFRGSFGQSDKPISDEIHVRKHSSLRTESQSTSQRHGKTSVSGYQPDELLQSRDLSIRLSSQNIPGSKRKARGLDHLSASKEDLAGGCSGLDVLGANREIRHQKRRMLPSSRVAPCVDENSAGASASPPKPHG
ncbi:MAG: hypothetical protein Q9187_000491 [Circinaria calcarea]